MPRPRPQRKGKRQRFYARNALKTTLDRHAWALDAIVLGHPCQPTRSDPNSSGADRLRRRMLRHAGASVCLCGCSGLACHRRHPSTGRIAGGPAERAFAKVGWSVAVRSYPAFAVSQFDLPEKTEAYQILRHPEGGRKDVFRWTVLALRLPFMQVSE